jgi:hypothetical protein
MTRRTSAASFRKLFLPLLFGFDHGIGHSAASVRGKSTSALEERGFRGLKFLSRVADTVIDADTSVG